jgi:anaerobic selenocysteine-containing dehydrogenase
MDRRSFIKLTAVSGSAAALASCGNPEHQVIRFLPEEELAPGIAEWHPGVCPLCSSGCGLTVRVMPADVETTRNGEHGVVRLGVAKKFEGLPAHPVNQGALCARGQAAIQLTYHPDRIAQPLKRSGSRGDGKFEPIAWDAAIAELVSKLDALDGNQRSLTILTGARRSHRPWLFEQFAAKFGAPQMPDVPARRSKAGPAVSPNTRPSRHRRSPACQRRGSRSSPTRSRPAARRSRSLAARRLRTPTRCSRRWRSTR